MAKSASNKRGPLHPLVDTGQDTVAGVLIGSLAILIASAAVGLIVNHFSPRRVPLFPRVREQEQVALPLPPGVSSASLGQARAALGSRSAVFLDARGAAEYAHGHIPGALNLPPKEFDARFPELADKIEQAESIVVYCQSIECGDAVDLADRLRELIPRPISVFDEGWQAWQAAHYPSTEGARP